jgi:hypothetical protein
MAEISILHTAESGVTLGDLVRWVRRLRVREVNRLYAREAVPVVGGDSL